MVEPLRHLGPQRRMRSGQQKVRQERRERKEKEEKRKTKRKQAGRDVPCRPEPTTAEDAFLRSLQPTRERTIGEEWRKEKKGGGKERKLCTHLGARLGGVDASNMAGLDAERALGARPRGEKEMGTRHSSSSRSSLSMARTCTD